GWIAVNIAPLDITLELGVLSQRVHSVLTTIAPFAVTGQPLARMAWGVSIAFTSTLPRGAAVPTITLRDRRLLTPIVVSGAAASPARFAIVEAGQLFLPTRSPDPTDVAMGVIGALGGLFLGRWIGEG